MKRLKKILTSILSMVLVIAMAGTSYVFASSGNESSFKVIYENTNQKAGFSERTSTNGESLFYTYSDKSLSYCAQITNTGAIQFSYYNDSTGDIVESSIIQISELFMEYGIDAREDKTFTLINHAILKSISESNEKHIAKVYNGNNSADKNASQPKASAATTLAAAVAGDYGSNYSGVQVGYLSTSYEGFGNIMVRCFESQSTTNTTPNTYSFAANMAFTSIVAWAISGNWTWIGLVEAFLGTVVSYTIVNGVYYTIKNFTAERSKVTIMRTQSCKVDGYPGTYYWSGWTIKRYYIKGDKGWMADTAAYYDFKYSDYDDISTLLYTAYQNFVNTVINGF